MKTIEIRNQYGVAEITNLKGLRNAINERRKNRFILDGKKDFTPLTTDKGNKQVACHYKSFEIQQMNLEKALEVYNLGGIQTAVVLN